MKSIQQKRKEALDRFRILSFSDWAKERKCLIVQTDEQITARRIAYEEYVKRKEESLAHLKRLVNGA